MTRTPARLAGLALFACLIVWRLFHPSGLPWGNRWGDPDPEALEHPRTRDLRTRP